MTLDLDYSEYNQQEIENVTSDDLNKNGQLVNDPFRLMGDMPSLIKIMAGKMDYVHPFSKKQNWRQA